MATSGHESESINVGGLKDTLQKYKTDISDKKYVKPSGGIPKTDLASAVQTSLGKADSSLQSHQTIKQDGITGATLNRFGTCSTAAATAAKTVTITSGTFSLEAGASVRVKFSNANTAGTPTLNVYNGSTATGAKNIFHKGSQITTGGNKALLAGVCDFVYDGTQYHLVGNYIDTNTWNAASSSQAGYVPAATKGKFLHSNASTGNLEWVNDNNTTYTPQKLGSGIGTCSTSSGTALVVTLSGYELVQNGFVAVTFANDVPANATLNVNGKGAKPIIYKGSAITADTIKADNTVMFCYNGSQYVVTSLGGGGGFLEYVSINITTSLTPSDLIGATVVVKDEDNNETILSTTWQGTVIECSVSAGINYSVTAGSVTSYATPSPKNYKAKAGYTRSITIQYVSDKLVDLGLPSGTLWAVGNVEWIDYGETGVKIGTETVLGGYISFGNIDPHFSTNHSKFDHSYSFDSTKYNNSQGKNVPGTDTTSASYSESSGYDFGHENLGSPYRMPTVEDYKELKNNTTSVWTSKNGINGREFTSNINGQKIFFPASGYGNGPGVSAYNTECWYATSSAKSSSNQYLCWMTSSEGGYISNEARYMGISVRLVV